MKKKRRKKEQTPMKIYIKKKTKVLKRYKGTDSSCTRGPEHICDREGKKKSGGEIIVDKNRHLGRKGGCPY
jgi:hypothetical protein